MSTEATAPVASGRRGVRTLPFSRETFECLTKSFHIHGSIAKVISRSDVPVFTCDKVHMSQPSYGKIKESSYERDELLSAH